MTALEPDVEWVEITREWLMADATGLDMLAELAGLDDGLEPVPDYATNPRAWMAETLGEVFWSMQETVWQSTLENTHTAVLSCNNSGKTFLAARIVAWWVSTYWREGCRVVTTAPSAAQVRLLLWQEIRDAFTKAKELGKPFPGRIVYSPYPQWKIGDIVTAFGRKPADHESSAMQGVHAPHVLVVLDEAGGISPVIWNAVEKITTTGHVSVLAIGNPDDPSAPFAAMCKPDSGWNVINIDGLRTPNFTEDRVGPLTSALMRHEGIPFNTEEIPDAIRPSMLNPDWVEGGFTRWCGIPADIVDKMGPEELGRYLSERTALSQLFTVAVRGQFSDGGGESVIPIGWLKRAQERWRDWDMAGRPEPVGRLIGGVDVATTNGADDTCIILRQGLVILEAPHIYPEGETDETADRVIVHLKGGGQAIAVVDSIGIGAGVRDFLRKAGLATVAFNAAEQSGRTDRHGEFKFLNDRAAAWWRLREMLDPAYGARLAIPPDPDLEKELIAPKWKVTIGKEIGVIQVESKDAIRKRLKHSTDRADALIHSTWIDGAPLNAAGATSPAIPYGGHAPGDAPRVHATSRTGSSGVIAYELEDL